ncbi:MAG: acyltransferase [Dermatophilaceae bacterium]
MSATPTQGTGAGRHAPTQPARRPLLPHLQELEAWRALAAIAVMLTHAGFLSGATGRDVLPGFLARMEMGVALFFVLSGFLLYRPHAIAVTRGTAPPGLRRYAVRRAARIVPAWAAVLVGVLVLVPQSRTAPGAAWIANLLQLQALTTRWDLPGLAQLWSLSTEVAFYVALPLLAMGIRRLVGGRPPSQHVAALMGLLVMCWGFRLAVESDLLPAGFSWNRTLPATLDWFVFGMLLAVVLADRDHWAGLIEIVRRSGNALLVIAAALFWMLTTSIAGPYDLRPSTAWQSSMRHLGFGLVAALLVYPSAAGARTVLTTALRSPVLAYLGRISYGFFLWHMPVMFWVRSIMGYELFAGYFWMTVVLTTAVTVVLASVSWHLLERPVLERARRHTDT